MPESSEKSIRDPSVSSATGSTFDPKKYVIYLPKHMWEATFVDIWKESDIDFHNNIVDFPLGVETEKRHEAEIIAETISQAEYDYKSKGLTPIFIFPLATVKVGRAKERIKILAPAFKTRDDIFLILRKGRTEPKKISEDEFAALVAPKGQDITTTALAKLYGRELETGIIDSIFNRSYMSLGAKTKTEIPYSLHVASSGDRRVLVEEQEYHCLVAAGPELYEFFANPNQWLAVVNLNAWICRRFELPYFVRALFCSLNECFHQEKDQERNTHYQNLIAFWYEFVKAGLQWLKKVKDRCEKAHKACVAAKTPYPVQAPSIMDSSKPMAELASNIWSCIEFTKRASKVSDSCFELKFADFQVAGMGVFWEILRQYDRGKLGRIFFDYCVWKNPDDTDSKIYEQLLAPYERKQILDKFTKDSPKFKWNEDFNVEEEIANSFLSVLSESDKKDFKKEELKTNINSMIKNYLIKAFEKGDIASGDPKHK